MPLFAVDTTIFSNFAHAGHPELLQHILWRQAITTHKVMAELLRGVEQGLVPKCDWSWIELAVLDPMEAAMSEEFQRVVHPAEAECLAIAVTRSAIFLSDDLVARRLATMKGVVVSGTLGILQGIVEQRFLTLAEADGLLHVMIEYGYRSPVHSLTELGISS